MIFPGVGSLCRNRKVPGETLFAFHSWMVGYSPVPLPLPIFATSCSHSAVLNPYVIYSWILKSLHVFCFLFEILQKKMTLQQGTYSEMEGDSFKETVSLWSHSASYLGFGKDKEVGLSILPTLVSPCLSVSCPLSCLKNGKLFICLYYSAKQGNH